MYSICCLKVIHVMNRKDNNDSIYLLPNTLLCWTISIQLPSLSYYMIVMYNLFVDFDIDYNFTMFILFFFPFSLFLLQINADYFSYSSQISTFSTKKQLRWHHLSTSRIYSAIYLCKWKQMEKKYPVLGSCFWQVDRSLWMLIGVHYIKSVREMV